jgi:hypothetical protein
VLLSRALERFDGDVIDGGVWGEDCEKVVFLGVIVGVER